MIMNVLSRYWFKEDGNTVCISNFFVLSIYHNPIVASGNSKTNKTVITVVIKRKLYLGIIIKCNQILCACFAIAVCNKNRCVAKKR
jgi:hypothetical protein